MTKLFPTLDLWNSAAQTGAMHMAWDEAMLRAARRPVLRIYRWQRAEVSFGYPMRWNEVEKFCAGRPAVRRWTGGGLVEHGSDLTIALAIPRFPEIPLMSPSALYEKLHGAVVLALGSPSARLASAADVISGSACFSSPVAFDVLNERQKIAGGALRRSREGILYQGSIQTEDLPENFVEAFAAALAEESREWIPPADFPQVAAHLHSTRYATREWLEKR